MANTYGTDVAPKAPEKPPVTPVSPAKTGKNPDPVKGN